MKRKSGLLFLLMIVMLLVTPMVFAGGEGETQSGPIKMKLSHPSAETHRYHRAALMFKEEVEKRTEGRVEIQIFPLNQLGSQEEVTEAAQMGTIDLVITSDDKLMTLVPEFEALGLPFIFRDHDHVYDALNGEVGNLLSTKLEKKNLMVISWLENGFRQVTNNKRPINSAADLANLKIRVSSSKPNMLFFNSCGAASTNISFSELYTALQLNTVDSQENPLANIRDKKFFEVQDYLTITSHVHTSEPLIMSKSAYNKLSEPDRKVFIEVGKSVSKFAFDDAKKGFDDDLEYLKEQGMQVNYAERDAFAEAIEVVYNQYGTQYKDFINIIEQY